MSIQGVPSSMLACQIVEFNKPHEIREVPTPKSIGDHDLLLRVAVSSLCHSDLEYQAGVFPSQLPITASHEGTGVVVAKGKAAIQFEIGDRILASQTYNRCGECDDCKGPENFRHYCNFKDGAMSVTRDGAFAEYLVVDARESTKIPDAMKFETAAPLACAGITIWRGVLQAELKPGQWLGIVGSGGGLGHLGIQFAKAKGLKVLGVDARDDGLALSKEVGADVVLDARKGKDYVIEEAMKITNGKGVDATINVSDAKVAPETACAITRMHGTMVQIAVVSLELRALNWHRLTSIFRLNRSAFHLESTSSATFMSKGLSFALRMKLRR